MHAQPTLSLARARAAAGSATSAGGGAGENVGELGNLPRVLRHSIHVYPVYHYTETRAARCRPQSAPSDACKRRASTQWPSGCGNPRAAITHTTQTVCDPGARCPAFIAYRPRPSNHSDLSLEFCHNQSCPSNAPFPRPCFRPRPLRNFTRSTRHWARGIAASLNTRRRPPHKQVHLPDVHVYATLASRRLGS